MSDSIFNGFPHLAERKTATPIQVAARNKIRNEDVTELWIFLGCVLAFFTCIRVIRTLYYWIRKPTSAIDSPSNEKADPEAPNSIKPNRISIRNLPSAISSAFRIAAFRWSVSILGCRYSFSELTFIFGYISSMFLFLFVNTWGLNSLFYQGRSAHLASSQLPLIIALAGKNNVISWLTGISHEKLNVLHRAAARTSLIFFWIHAITRTINVLAPKFHFSEPWIVEGCVSLVALTLATILSLRPIRNKYFEFFLISHIVLVALVLMGAYLHLKHESYPNYMWPAFGLWGFDRFVRVLRILWNNRVWSRKNPDHSLATVELLSSNTVRLTLRRKFSWSPGQHAYIIMPTVSALPIETHPFTIASIPESDKAMDNEVVFLIRGRSGFTQRLRDHADRHGIGSIPAYIDGPYGSPPNLHSFSTCVMFAGGSGISYTLPLLLNLIRENVRGGNSAVRRILFVWIVRDGGHVKWLSKSVSSALSSTTSSLSVETIVHVTGRPKFPTFDKLGRPESLSSTGSSLAGSSVASSSGSEKDLSISETDSVESLLTLYQGRPDIRKILHDEISASSGPVSVDVAGPSALSYSIRRALISDVATPISVLKGLPSVVLHVETFGMNKS